MSNTKVLLVEDDQSLSEIVVYNLKMHDFTVIAASDGQVGLNAAFQNVPDIVLLDVMLPSMDGIEVCRRIRKNPALAKTIVVMLTAKAEESDQLLGFSVGADEYVVKPFSIKVLLERVKAIQRRLNTKSVDESNLEYEELVVNRVRHEVTLSGEQLYLTPSEFRLLESLMREPGRAFDRKDLIEMALGEETVVLERTIDVHIRSLRKKLGVCGDWIETVRGVGYRFQAKRDN